MSGTYKHCSNCKVQPNCCCDFSDTIDNIVVTNLEYNLITTQYPEYKQYFKRINSESFHLLSRNGVCPFYTKGCSIYAVRPSDCRLFPFDLKRLNDEYYLIRYDLPCGSKNVTEIPWSAIEELKTIMTTYTASEIETKVDQLPFEIIQKI